MQVTIDRPLNSRGRLETPATKDQIYSYTNADALASTSSLVAS